MLDLKPCPLCGEKELLHAIKQEHSSFEQYQPTIHAAIHCKCGISFTLSAFKGFTIENVVYEWNRREPHGINEQVI